MKHDYKTPQILEIQMFPEGILAASTFRLEDYQSNGEAIDLDF